MKPCLMCGEHFKQGDRGVVIGHVEPNKTSELRWVHIVCVLRDVLGTDAAEEYERKWTE